MEPDSDPFLTKKQELLQKEIIDQNYDKTKFINFCLSKKENGDDLTKWTLTELNDIIVDFIKTISEEKEKKEKESKKAQSEGKIKEEITNDIQKLKICKTMSNDDKYFEKEIICKKLDKSALNGNNVSIIIRDPKPVETGFFGSNYVTYEVFTEPFSWSVRRRYSDFEWLRNAFCKLFPGHMIPPLPNKKIGARRFEVDFVEKRMQFLQRFLKAICESEYFKSSEALIAFVSCTDRTMFENKMKEINAYQASLYIEDIKTFDGKVTVVDDEDNEKYFINIRNYFRLQTQLFERLIYNLKNFYTNIENACVNLEDVQKDFETLHLLNSRVLMKDEITKSFEEFGIYFKNWRRIMFNQNEIIKSNVKDFFKYVKMEGNAYSELIKNREDCKAKYNTELLRMNVKKEKLWNQMDISKWDMNEEEKIDRQLLTKDKTYAFKSMCYKETTSLNNLHNKLGYMNKMNIDELKRMISLNCTRFIKNMKDFVENFYPSLTDVNKIKILIY